MSTCIHFLHGFILEKVVLFLLLLLQGVVSIEDNNKTEKIRHTLTIYYRLYNSDILVEKLLELGFERNYDSDSIYSPGAREYNVPEGVLVFKVKDCDFYHIRDSSGSLALSFVEKYIGACNMMTTHSLGSQFWGDYWIWLYQEPRLFIPAELLWEVPEDILSVGDFWLQRSHHAVSRTLFIWEENTRIGLNKKYTIYDPKTFELPVGVVEHTIIQ